MYINCNCCYCLCFCIYDSVDVQALQINYVYDMFATGAYRVCVAEGAAATAAAPKDAET